VRCLSHLLLLPILLSGVGAEETMTVGLYGAVGQAGKYELPSGSGTIRLIHQAGGITCNACPAHLGIRRDMEDGKRQYIHVDAYAIVTQGKSDIPLQPGDLVFANSHVISHLDCSEIRAFNEALPKYLESE